MQYTDEDVVARLEAASTAHLDELEFGVIGMTKAGVVDRYNTYESKLSGLSAERVLGKGFFTEVAPCTNNYLVSLRYEESAALDELIPYVFTLRMRPRKVELRMLKVPGVSRQYLLVRERTS